MWRNVGKTGFAGGLALLLVLIVVAPARGGTFTISGTCGLWRPYTNGGSWVSPSSSCPLLKATNPVGGYSSPVGGEGGWIFDTPAGTAIGSFSIQGDLLGVNGWQAAVLSTNGGVVENCPGASCPGAYKYLYSNFVYPANNSGQIVLRLRCGAAGGCPNNQTYGNIHVFMASVTLVDTTAPGVAITGGPLASGGWHRGSVAVSYDAWDHSGIKSVRAYLDGRPRAEEPRGCDYSAMVPCPNGGGALNVDTTGLPDGAHTLVVQTVDTGSNTAQDVRTVYTDNAAPTAPVDAKLSTGGSWTATNSFDLSWTNPAESASPIAGAEYLLCPADSSTGDSRGCVSKSASGTNLRAVREIQVPKAGAWKLSLVLRDAAGNANPSASVSPPLLQYDATAPTLSFLPMSADDPTRVRLAAADETSGIATRALEIRREGTDAWVPVPVIADGQGFSSALDDGDMPNGLYHLRARVTDAAGNERSVETTPDGQAAVLALPVRLKTRLAVGRVTKVRARASRSGKPRYRRVLVTRPRSRYGRTVPLHGRLTTPGANPVASADVEVWEQLSLPGAAWTQIATVQTSRTGRFMFKALRGPSRLVQFRYRGTAVVRSRTTTVDLRVKATTTMRANRHHVKNGDDVTFRGRLGGRPIPPGGKLVELQVYSRRKWRTFGTARANETTGLWGYRYRFEAIVGRVSFRFRARIRKEATYPFDLGTSRRVRVSVRGQ